MIKPTQGAMFKRFRDQLIGVTESKDPGPGNPEKYCEDKVSKNVQKIAGNVAPAHK